MANEVPKKRRPKGDGSYQKLANGKYKVAISIGSGKNRSRKTSTVDSPKEAVAMLTKFRTEQANGTLVASSKTTFGAYAQRWLDLKKHQIAPTTWDSYASSLKTSLLGELGDIPLDKLRTSHINDYVTACHSRGLASATVARYSVMIHGVLETAMDEGLLGINVARKSQTVKKSQEEVEVYTDAETKKLLAESVKYTLRTGRFYRPLYYIVLFALATGARRGEMLALRWDNVNTTDSTVTIKESVSPVTGGRYIGTPKTKASLRTIAVDARVITELLKTKTESPFVFHAINGSMFHPAQISKWYRELLKGCGLQGRHFHALRHTHATRLIVAGHSIKAVSERLGHSSIAITLSLYVHNDVTQDKGLADDAGSWLF